MFGFRFRDKQTAAPAASAEEWRAQGNAAIGRGALEEAARFYRAAVEADPADPLARVSLGYVLLEQGRAAEAGEWLAQAIAKAAGRTDTLADAHYLRAQAQRLQGDDDAAVVSLRAALEGRPGFIEALQELVRLLLQKRRADEAVAIAQRAAAMNTAPDVLMLLGQALHGAGNPSAALAALDALLAREPAHAEALQSRGALLMELGRATEALRDFDQVLAHQGATADALCNGEAVRRRIFTVRS